MCRLGLEQAAEVIVTAARRGERPEADGFLAPQGRLLKDLVFDFFQPAQRA